MAVKKINLLFLFLFCFVLSQAATSRYRLSAILDPSKNMTIGWDQTSGANAVVYYDIVDHGTTISSYANSKSVDASNNTNGMNNRFVTLTQLIPNTKYYFVIHDADGSSDRYYFKTLPSNNQTPLSIIAGGDSRAGLNSSGPRLNANKMVSKLRPDLILFGGDYTWLDLSYEWKEWLDDWQLTVSPDGRMYPGVWERGNHEYSPGTIHEIFNIPTDEYYNVPIGNFLNIYTLNTEISVLGNQATWLKQSLQQNQHNFDWNIAQYHRCIVATNSGKPMEHDQYQAWAQTFYDYGVQLVIESDAHDIKYTWPISPSTAAGSDHGFKKDTVNGTVYIGEGCWGAPIRSSDAKKSWTRNADSFDGFHWLKVTKDTIEVRTVKTHNVSQVGNVTEANPFNYPNNIDIWNPSHGEVVYITNHKRRPNIDITYPFQAHHFHQPQALTIKANASASIGTIDSVKFYINDILISVDQSAPYEVQWNIPSNGEYVVTAFARDSQGWVNISEEITVFVGEVEVSSQISNDDDDAEETLSDGDIDLNDDAIDINEEEILFIANNQLVGLRFVNVKIPSGAKILEAYIQFTARENELATINTTISGELIENSTSFTNTDYDLSNRTKTLKQTNWAIPSWLTGQASHAERSPNIKEIIQEIIDQPSWQYKNALSLFISENGNSGTKSFFAHDDTPAKSAKLIIKFTSPIISELTNNIKQEITNFNIFPNPSNGSFSIQFPEPKTRYLVEIKNVNGQTVYSKQIKSSLTPSRIHTLLNSGNYFISISHKNQKFSSPLIVNKIN